MNKAMLKKNAKKKMKPAVVELHLQTDSELTSTKVK